MPYISKNYKIYKMFVYGHDSFSTFSILPNKKVNFIYNAYIIVFFTIFSDLKKWIIFYFR